MNLMTTKELAEKLRVKTTYIDYLRRTNQIPHIKLSERRVRFAWEDVETWIQERRRMNNV